MLGRPRPNRRLDGASRAQATDSLLVEQEDDAKGVSRGLRLRQWRDAGLVVLALLAVGLVVISRPLTSSNETIVGVQFNTKLAPARVEETRPVLKTDEQDGYEPDGDASAAEGGGAEVNVCVRAPNPRVASVFIRNYFAQFGGRLKFVPSKQLQESVRVFVQSGALSSSDPIANAPACEPDWPILNLVFQNALVRGRALPPGTLAVVGDEMCRCGPYFCGDAAKVPLRQYASSGYSSAYLPLGPRFEFAPVSQDEVRPASQRALPFNFIGAPTSPSRTTLVGVLRDPGAARAHSFVSDGLLHVTPRWKRDPTADGYLAPQRYRQVLLDSVFTLCPSGNNPEAFRIFEAVDSGSIPVLALDESYQSHACKDAFGPLLASGAPFVVLQSWDQLPSRLETLLADPAKLDKMQADLAAWRSDYWLSVAQRLDCTVLKMHTAQSALGAARFNLNQYCPEALLTTLPTPTRVLQRPVLRRPAPAALAAPSTIPLITGCGRSGTLSVMQYLKSIGVPAVHENARLGAVSVSWLYAADAPRYPFETLQSQLLRKRLLRGVPGTPVFGPVVQLTRHPLKVISSTRRCFCGRGDRDLLLGQRSDAKSWRFAEAHLRRMRADWPVDDIGRSAIYWLDWNLLIERRFPQRTHLRLEDLDPAVLVSGLGLTDLDSASLPHAIPRAAFHTSPEREKLRLPDVTWADLLAYDKKLARDVFDLAQRYGYEAGMTLEDAAASGA